MHAFSFYRIHSEKDEAALFIRTLTGGSFRPFFTHRLHLLLILHSALKTRNSSSLRGITRLFLRADRFRPQQLFSRQPHLIQQRTLYRFISVAHFSVVKWF